MSFVVWLLLHKYENGAVPPLTVRLIAPLLLPVHVTATGVADKPSIVPDSLTVAEVVFTHPYKSVTVTEYVPPLRPLMSFVVWLLLHKYEHQGRLRTVTEREVVQIDLLAKRQW